MNKLISFYKSQKQKFWTHFLLPFTYILGTTIIFTYYIENPFVFYATFAYLCVFPIIIYIIPLYIIHAFFRIATSFALSGLKK